MTGANEDLLYQVTDGVGWITLNRPQARNALTFAMYEGLAARCKAAAKDESLRALVITGAGDKAFAAGTDIAQFRAFETASDALAYEARIEGVLHAVECCPLPTIAAIVGACTGGGAGIAAACDLRIASRDLRFGFPIARTLGNCLSVTNLARLSALVGPGRVTELIFTARLLGAEEALAAGLVSEVLEDAAAVKDRAASLAQTLAGHAPLTLQATKEALRRLRAAAAEIDDDDLIRLCYTSQDFREGLEAFLAKRPPKWQGR
ncbi:MAG: enoyl-CoA hydratase/isomerase family protein [Rhodospirillales bacterium]